VRASCALLAAAVLAAPRGLAAQDVGHQPEQSPYRDILTHQGFTVFAGRFAGNTGAAGTGARPGMVLGARLQMRVSAAVDLWATMGQALSGRERFDVSGDTTKDMGSIKVRLLLADLALVLNLTGDKTWHGFAPYAAMGIGLAWPSQKVVDPGGFELGSNFTLVPTLGTRWFVSRDFALRLEARDYYYRMSYPLQYYPLTLTHQGLVPYSVSDRQWYNNVTFWFGVTYGFNF
jgi:hypothetical protein